MRIFSLLAENVIIDAVMMPTIWDETSTSVFTASDSTRRARLGLRSARVPVPLRS